MATKVIVVVSGGNVQHCYADDANVEIEVVDFDNIAEEGRDAIRVAEARLGEVSATMAHVY